MPSGPMPPPSIDCLPLPLFATDQLAAVRKAFADAAPILLRQAWLDTPEQGFAPGLVRTGWRGSSLLVFAELSDHNIFTQAQRHNDRFWQLGDTFEMFLQPPGGTPYFELHVAPNNLRLQLRFVTPPSGAASAIDPFSTALIPRDVFDSRTWVNPEAREWCVFAEIPAASLIGQEAGWSGPATAALAGSTWRFSFSRYDYTRGREQPVISSSSPHAEPAFHRPHEWGYLHLAF